MSLIRRLRRFAAAEKSGLAALEFAIIAPMMILLIFGSVDLIDTLGADKRAQNAASSIADVVARDDAVSNDEIAGLWAALDVLMYPDPGASMTMRVSSIRIESATSARVVWSEGRGMTARVANTTVSLPSQMMTPGTSVIMTESSYPYEAPLGFLHSGSVNLEHNSIRRSRLIDPIPRVP
jgi:Flp pilus assembly protein TadG